MNLVEKEISVRNHHFILTNQRALFWKDERSLIISDLHLGKTAHFRKNGIALPDNMIHQDLQRLSYIIEFYKAEKLIIVGDFIHAGKNSEFEIFKSWKLKHPNLEIILIKGNHDRISEKYFYDLSISSIHAIYMQKNLAFSHENTEIEKHFVISGHLHPGVRMKTPTKKYLKFPCYIVHDNYLVLPAFSSFTGLDTTDYFPFAHKFIFGDDFLMKL